MDQYTAANSYMTVNQSPGSGQETSQMNDRLQMSKLDTRDIVFNYHPGSNKRSVLNFLSDDLQSLNSDHLQETTQFDFLKRKMDTSGGIQLGTFSDNMRVVLKPNIIDALKNSKTTTFNKTGATSQSRKVQEQLGGSGQFSGLNTFNHKMKMESVKLHKQFQRKKEEIQGSQAANLEGSFLQFDRKQRKLVDNSNNHIVEPQRFISGIPGLQSTQIYLQK
uniref:Uncharacterized protein n=1 Tax=Strombidium rassoulzadegani TaxID=1082188 RepID=A0A7S3FV63_9SPIT|mmetsp:Transcript_3890/g.6613  ORF Transcript_3890/g.6613 Transcript_3890/m.6613 type:complete len:220 (+) Transcript_3890:777-1436(+)